MQIMPRQLNNVFYLLLGRCLWLGLILATSACSSSSTSAIDPNVNNPPQRGEDGMLLLYVPEGDFFMGSSNQSDPPDEQPRRRIYLDAFWIDQTEISNANYDKCVKAGNCPAIVSPRPDILEHPDYPVQGVTWTDARTYCEWVGRRLPTEAEWEKAARGTDGAIFPWGNDSPNRKMANFNRQNGDVMPIASYPAGASPYGALDMAGNVYEWVQDWYSENYYLLSPSENPTGPESGLTRVLKGGAWNGMAISLRAANRFWSFPYRNDFDGFRCATDVLN